MKPIYPITYIMSSDNIEKLEKDLEYYDCWTFKRVLGSYKGVQEKSLMVIDDREYTVLNIAKKHNQECVLKLDMTRFASLITPDGKVTPLGQFTAVNEKPDGDYTFDGFTFYTIK